MFFPSPSACRAAGFRACKRCHPDGASADRPLEDRLARILLTLQKEDTPDSVTELAAAEGFSPSQFQRQFKSALGVTPKQFTQALKHNRFRHAIREGQSLTGAIYDAGYSAPSRFYEKAARPLGMTPHTFTKGGQGRMITWTHRRTSLGTLMVGATDKGICFAALGEKPHLLKELQANFPKADLRVAPNDDPTEIHGWADHLARYVDGKDRWRLLPTDIQATAFQAKVYAALCQIPPGKTLTYTELAEAIGAPNSVRAAASACARNSAALVIPCHRIVPKGGGVGGYRWDPERKMRLLQIEDALEQKGLELRPGKKT